MIDRRASFPRALGILLFVLASLGCAQSTGPGDEGPFDRDVLEACMAGTSSVSVHTNGGGRMSLRILGGCFGEPSCESTDLFAPDAWATVRVAGTELLVDGCSPISAVSGTALEVTFRPTAGELETYSIPLAGACLDAGPGGCTPPPRDGGVSMVDASAPMVDAGTGG